jgi:hypothetical protein
MLGSTLGNRRGTRWGARRGGGVRVLVMMARWVSSLPPPSSSSSLPPSFTLLSHSLSLSSHTTINKKICFEKLERWCGNSKLERWCGKLHRWLKVFLFLKGGEFPPPASLRLYHPRPSFTFSNFEKIKILWWLEKLERWCGKLQGWWN